MTKLLAIWIVLGTLLLVFLGDTGGQAAALGDTEPTPENPPAAAEQISEAAPIESPAGHEPATGYPIFSVERLEVKPTISRSWTQRNHTFTVAATVSNRSTVSGTYSAVLQINGTKSSVNNLVIAGGASEVVEFAVVQRLPGTYEAVVSPFMISGVRLDPPYARPGQTVTVSTMVTNAGGKPCQEDVVLKLDGSVIAVQNVSLNGGESTKVEFVGITRAEGIYTIESDAWRVGFKVGTKGYILDRILGGTYAIVLVLGIVLSMKRSRRTSSD